MENEKDKKENGYKKDSEFREFYDGIKDYTQEEIDELKDYYMHKDDYANVERTINEKEIYPGLFSGAQIYYYLKNHKIVIGYKKELIKNATYEMRLGNRAIRWDNAEKEEMNVKDKGKLRLKPNSLTFVTTIEKFNLPVDIIARFNLKSKYVHKGLLLGTGPIVDPEFQSRIVIPLHNFSSEPVTIDYGDPFISVEFTKCLVHDPGYEGYVYKSNKNKSIPEEEFFAKTFAVGSSVMKSLEESQRVKEATEKSLEKFKTIGYLAILASIIAILTLFFMMFQSLSSAQIIAVEAKKDVEQLEYKIENLEQAINNLTKNNH